MAAALPTPYRLDRRLWPFGFSSCRPTRVCYPADTADPATPKPACRYMTTGIVISFGPESEPAQKNVQSLQRDVAWPGRESQPRATVTTVDIAFTSQTPSPSPTRRLARAGHLQLISAASAARVSLLRRPTDGLGAHAEVSSYFLRLLRFCNCSENYSSETNRNSGWPRAIQSASLSDSDFSC